MQASSAGRRGTFYLLEDIPRLGRRPGASRRSPSIDSTSRNEKDRKNPRCSDQFLQVSANGEKMLFGQTGNRYTIASTVTPLRPGEGVVNVGDMEVYIDPRAEWKQIYNEVWRIQRDFFYDPGLHGLNLAATRSEVPARILTASQVAPI